MKIVIGLAIWLALAGSVLACDGLNAESAWVRLPPPGMPMTAGYVRLTNSSASLLTVDAVSSQHFGDVSLHQTVDVDGVSRMRPALPLSIKAGSTHVLEPGGYHLMLMQPKQELHTGEHVTIHFQCDGRSADIPFTLRKDAP